MSLVQNRKLEVIFQVKVPLPGRRLVTGRDTGPRGSSQPRAVGSDLFSQRSSAWSSWELVPAQRSAHAALAGSHELSPVTSFVGRSVI